MEKKKKEILEIFGLSYFYQSWAILYFFHVIFTYESHLLLFSC